MRLRSGPVNWLFSSPLPVEAQVLLESQMTLTEVAAPSSEMIWGEAGSPLVSVGVVRVERLFQWDCATAGTPATSSTSKAEPVGSASTGSSEAKFKPIFMGLT